MLKEQIKKMETEMIESEKRKAHSKKQKNDK